MGGGGRVGRGIFNIFIEILKLFKIPFSRSSIGA
jgi:hypothetical protein